MLRLPLAVPMEMTASVDIATKKPLHLYGVQSERPLALISWEQRTAAMQEISTQCTERGVGNQLTISSNVPRKPANTKKNVIIGKDIL